MSHALGPIVLVAALLCAAASIADAACGDSVLEVGEQCDDGNVAAGDCCSPACQFEPISYIASCDHGREGLCWSHTHGICDGNGTCLPQATMPEGQVIGRRVALRDAAGEDDDWISWKLRQGRYKCYDDVPGGDPSVDATYAFCVWSAGTFGPYSQYYLDELLSEIVIAPGEGWKQTAKGWEYRLKDATGSLLVRAQNQATFKGKGAYSALPGPANGSVYFDSHAWFALVNSAGYRDFMGGPGDRNTSERYRADYGYSCD